MAPDDCRLESGRAPRGYDSTLSFTAQAGWPQLQWPDISARWLAQ